MPHERLLTDKGAIQSPGGRLPELARIWQLGVLLYSLLATFLLWTLVQAPPGIQHLLLLCLLRLAVLLCIAAVSYKAQRKRRAVEGLSPPLLAGSGYRSSSAPPGSSLPASPRSALARAALYLQVAWLASELVLGTVLFAFYPQILGPLASTGGTATAANSAGALLAFLPLLAALVMSGCFLFLQRLARRRRQPQRQPHSPVSIECGLGAGHGRLAALSAAPCCSAALAGTCHHHAAAPGPPFEVLCSPSLSDDGYDFSSAASVTSVTSSSGAVFYSRSSSSSLGLGSGGAPSPTSHVYGGSEATAEHHEAALHAACQILLVEHQVDQDYCLFVHKKLRPIKTRPYAPNPVQPPSLLRELITNSFSFQGQQGLVAQLAAAVAPAPKSSAASSAASITFQAAVAATGLTAV